MNNDFLRLGARSEDEEVNEGGYAPALKSSYEKSKITVFNVINSTRKRKATFNRSPKLREFLTNLSVCFIAAVILYSVAFVFTDLKIFIFCVFLSSLIIPVYSVAAIKSAGLAENVSAGLIFVYFTAGAVFYSVIKILTDKVIPIGESVNWSDKLIRLLIYETTLFCVSFCFVKLAKKDDIFSAILITVAVCAGGTLARNNLFFINAISDLGGYGGAKVTGYITAFFPQIIRCCLVVPVFSFALSVINGFAIAFITAPVKENKLARASFLLLFAITLILSLIAEFPTTLLSVYLILNAIALVSSIFFAIKLFDYALGKKKK